MHNNDEHRELIDILPLETIEYAFAYGSGAIEQSDEDKQSKMVDFILVTRDSRQFHHENLRINKKHYSLIRWFGLVNNLQHCGGNFN